MPANVGAVEVYWYDDRISGGHCRVPQSWQVLYRDGDQWKPVANPSPYAVEGDKFNRVTFDPITTGGLRLDVELQDNWSAGVLEWRVEAAR